MAAMRVFYDESLSGVIQWVFAAPLFSINLFFLTALVQRSLQPLRQLASWEGLDMLIENAVRVSALGPVDGAGDLFLPEGDAGSDLVQSGRPHSHGRRDMAEISSCRTMISAPWSLDIFTALLAYDAMRVLIWFDHMGLRVATLVNLSFVGGDALDEEGGALPRQGAGEPRHSGRHRRFGTWAPLLCPSTSRAAPNGTRRGPRPSR